MRLQDLKTLSREKNIPVSALRDFIQLGLPHFRRPRKIYIDPEEFDAWFAKNFRTIHQDDFRELNNIIEEAMGSLV